MYWIEVAQPQWSRDEMSQRISGSTIDKVLELLEDGELHATIELAEELDMSIETVEQILSFLSEFDLVEYDPDTGARITESGLRFLSLPTG